MTTVDLDQIEVTSATVPHGIVEGLRVSVLNALGELSAQEDEEIFSDGEVHYATFGTRYAREAHPTLGLADPDSSIRVEGLSSEAARTAIFAATDGHFAFVYPEATFIASLHPLPPVLEIVATLTRSTETL